MAPEEHPNPFLLAATSPLSPMLLPLLHANPSLASIQDTTGYSLLHAAASYNHESLLRALVQEFHVDVNLLDSDGETCLFVCETVAVARCLVEELHVDVHLENDEGMTAAKKFEAEDEFPEVAAYLCELALAKSSRSAAAGVNGVSSTTTWLPQLPPNVTIDVAAQPVNAEDLEVQEPDPEFRRRIEELAAKENFNTEDGQRELRELITDVVRRVSNSNNERDVRRRVG